MNQLDQLKSHIVSALNLDVAPEDIGNEDPLFGEGLGLDSIDALELVVMIEREYGIVISDRETATRAFASPQTLAQFIQEKLQCPKEPLS